MDRSYCESSRINRNNYLIRKKNTNEPRESSCNRFGQLQQTLGNQVYGKLVKSGLIQSKLKIGSPGDIYEMEADRVADQVMRMNGSNSLIRRMCNKCEDESHGKSDNGVQRMCSECEEELHRKSLFDQQGEITTKGLSGQVREVSSGTESRINQSGSGRSMSGSVINFFEPRFGYDFSNVKIHTDANADTVNRKLNSRAFTVGNEIYFRRGEYNPGSFEGKRLLAHELTHVVQQGSNKNNTTDLRRTKSSSVIQRLTRRTRVSCPAGQNPYSADRRASQLLDRAYYLIHSAEAYRQILPNDADVLAVSSALRTAFRLNPNNARTWDHWVPIIKRRIEIAKNYIDSVVFQFDCIGTGASFTIPGCAAGTCNAGTEAFTCPGNPTDMVLCPLFWSRGLNQRGRVIAHEVFHINFGFINDWGQPDVANAHCYAQFVALLNGFNSPAGFRCH